MGEVPSLMATSIALSSPLSSSISWKNGLPESPSAGVTYPLSKDGPPAGRSLSLFSSTKFSLGCSTSHCVSHLNIAVFAFGSTALRHLYGFSFPVGQPSFKSFSKNTF